MERTGGCHCGAIRYQVSGEPQHVALCHCSDCRRCAGAPVVSWAAFAEDELKVTHGAPEKFNSSGAAMRSFCGTCGTGLFYRNAEMLPGIVDIQSVTLDDAEALPPGAHIQTAERLHWMDGIDALPKFNRYPGMD
jgi:hypothetical protein